MIGQSVFIIRNDVLVAVASDVGRTVCWYSIVVGVRAILNPLQSVSRHVFDDLFLDLDPERGLKAGQKWQADLKRAAERCELVIFLVSPAWRAWEWCVAEFLLAKNMNKRIHSPVISIGRFCNGNGSGKYGTQASTKGQFSRDPNQKLCSCHKGRRPFHLAVLTSANGMDRPCS